MAESASPTEPVAAVLTGKRAFLGGKRLRADIKTKSISAEADEFVIRISTAYAKSVAAIIETGQLLNEAKARLKHGEFGTMTELYLPFSHRTAEMLMAIARNQVLANAKNSSHLPTAWTTLYELLAIPESDLQALIDKKVVTPETTAANIREWDYERFYQAARALEILSKFMTNMSPQTLGQRLFEQFRLRCWPSPSRGELKKLSYYFEELCEDLTKRSIEAEALRGESPKWRELEAQAAGEEPCEDADGKEVDELPEEEKAKISTLRKKIDHESKRRRADAVFKRKLTDKEVDDLAI